MIGNTSNLLEQLLWLKGILHYLELYVYIFVAIGDPKVRSFGRSACSCLDTMVWSI